jgi:hypothetical protein
LLFNALSMGVQNSMVTQISNSIVRTTHWQDSLPIWIELSQLFFIKKPNEQKSWVQYLFKVIDYYFLLLLYLWGFLIPSWK